MNFFLWMFYLFETFLGFVVSVRCSDTLPLSLLLGLGFLQQLLGCGSGQAEEILPRMRSSRASRVLRFKPSWVLFRSGLAGSWILNANTSQCL